MTQEEVEAVAKGRVWSGEDAKAHGLVDELGGYSVALRLAKEAANLPPEAPFTLTVFPREETLPELLYNRLTGADRERDEGGISSTSIEHSLKAVQPLLQRLEAVLDSPGVLTMRPFAPIR
jgi:protease-4